MIGKTIFSIFSGVIPIDMHYRFEREGVPKVPTAIVQLEEKTLVAAGMSMMWDTRDPSVAPIYAFRSKGYNLMNVLDPEVGGEMTTRILPEGERPWVDQIRDNFCIILLKVWLLMLPLFLVRVPLRILKLASLLLERRLFSFRVRSLHDLLTD
ncbi:hypothetical protein Hanom_Chr15g01388361 [Helianthus anomalus]